MKSLLRSILIYSAALYLTITYIPGVEFSGGYELLLVGGAALTLLLTFVRPVLKILFLPINILTLGIFSGLVNVLIIFLLTRFFAPLSISSWTFQRFEYQGYTIPEMHVSVLWTYILVSAIISFSANLLNWLCD